MMTTIDDPKFLVKFVRSCFIASDDTGICELLVEPDFIRDLQRERSNSKLTNSSCSDGENDLSVSPDLVPDIDIGRRRRSNTDLRIDKIKEEKAEKSKVKSVKWPRPDQDATVDESTLEAMFSKKEIKKTTPKSSGLSALMKAAQSVDPNSLNKFSEYEQYDGESHLGVPNKKIEIYLKMPGASEQPLTITVITTATVGQTIGLACWKYTNLGRQPELVKQMSLYSLHMTEDDGEVDHDIPPLAHEKPISKFGFTKLALVVKKPVPARRSEQPQARLRKMTPIADSRNQLVTMKPALRVDLEQNAGDLRHIPEHGSTKLLVDVTTTTMEELLQIVLERRNMGGAAKDSYQISNEMNQVLNHSTKVKDTNTREFYMISQLHGSVTGSVSRPLSLVSNAESVLQARDSNAKTYMVTMSARMLSNVQVHLVVGSHGVEILCPTTKNSLKSMLLPKHTFISPNSLLNCGVTRIKPNGKHVFVLEYLPGDGASSSRQHLLETLESSAMEIVSEISKMIDQHGGASRSTVAERHRRLSSFN